MRIVDAERTTVLLVTRHGHGGMNHFTFIHGPTRIQIYTSLILNCELSSIYEQKKTAGKKKRSCTNLKKKVIMGVGPKQGNAIVYPELNPVENPVEKFHSSLCGKMLVMSHSSQSKRY